MREEVLRKKGWTETEIAHARKIFSRAEQKKHPKLVLIEHSVFWTVILVLATGGVAFSLQLLPVVALATPIFTISLSFITGACLGMLLVHVIHDLKLSRKHQHLGVFVLLTSVIGLVLLILSFARGITGLSVGTSWLFSLIFGAGCVIPYLVHWRVFGETY